MKQTDFRERIDLAGERLGGTVLYANDDFFAPKENLLKPDPPVWKEHEYTDRGKWMDGWESRRKRTAGHDFCIIRLGLPGILRGVVVDTSYFKGNFPDACSLEACHLSPETSVESLLGDSVAWVEVLGKSKLEGDRENLLAIDHSLAFTHLRFNIYPDGGVARLRVHGEVIPDWRRAGGLGAEIDLAAAENGGDVLSCSDMFFGPKHNLIMPGRARNMSDGWETRRRRGPGHDWVIVNLAAEGTIGRIEIDTNHFKGNYPDTASIEGCSVSSSGELEKSEWREILPRTKLEAHTRHLFIDELRDRGPFTHARLNVYPDGGVSRLRLYGVVTENGRRGEAVRRINTLPAVEKELIKCCGSTEWARRVSAARPFGAWSQFTETADRIWQEVGPDGWLEAFSAHPRIGENKTSSGQAAAAHRWSSDEQSEVSSATSDVKLQLESANREYEHRFGRIFIVCATGKGADEMLAILRERLKNREETELRVAAEEQRKITHLRLEKMVTG